jgi:flagellin
MVVQHNLTAMNSNRMLGITTGAQAKSTEKLSSGYKINRAADDAAGLSISEKMRKQIRGLTQASANAQDGISAVQTAEGALNEVHDMLQRMNELAIKAANGTESESDRTAIQNEIDQITTEIDRVSETTKFNETYLLKGDASQTKGYTYSYTKLRMRKTQRLHSIPMLLQA